MTAGPVKACIACAFSVGSDHDPLFQCRRRAPLVTGGMMSNVETVWPKVEGSAWCGEFEPAKGDVRLQPPPSDVGVCGVKDAGFECNCPDADKPKCPNWIPF